MNGGYDRYPYGNYEQDPRFGFPMPPSDTRRPQKERVLGLRDTDGGAVAFPFGSLEAKGEWAALHLAVGRGRTPGVVFWDSSRRAAMAYHTQVGDEALTFQVGENGIEDMETGTLWSVDGRAISGALAGARLEPVGEAFVAFWGAWHAFYPDTHLWGPGKPKPSPSFGQ